MADVNHPWVGAPKPRSSPAPFIPIAKAIDRARQLYEAVRHHPAPPKAVVEAWGFGEKSSGGQQTIAALRQFGLLDGRGQNLQLTELALQIIRDQREESPERVAAIRRAALIPKIHAEMWEKWGADLPSDSTMAYFLEHQRGGYTDRSSHDVITEFRETISFAGLAESDKIEVQGGAKSKVEFPPPPAPTVKVGDYVQWTSGGVDQFSQPHQVIAFFDENHAQVFGSKTGIPVSELTVVAPPAALKSAATIVPQKTPSPASEVLKNIDIMMLGAGRLQITAEVNKAGLSVLRKMLDKYEGILDLLDTPIDMAQRPEDHTDEE